MNETTTIASERPECIACIKSPATGKPLCNRKANAFDWQFQGLYHAYETVLRGDRQVPCRQCVRNAIFAMEQANAQH